MSFDVKLRDYQVEASEGADKNRENGKRFTGVVSTTGSGKSFIAMHEIGKLTKRSNDGKVLFIAPTNEIISQFQRHIMNVIDPEGKRNFTEMRSSNGSVEDEDIIKNNSTTRFIQDYFKSEFGLDIEFHCYKYIEGKSDEFIHNMMKNVKLCILDEAHRAVAKEWEGRIKEMMQSSPDAQFLGITATPDRDADEKNAMDRLARASGDYSEEEIERGEHIASDILIEEAIRDGYVNEPEVYRFDRALDETYEYKELRNSIYREGISKELKEKLEEYKKQIDSAIGKEDSQDKDEEFAKFVSENINPNAKKGIVFIPPFSNQETEYLFEDDDSVSRREKYIEDYKARIEKMFEGTGKKVNFSVVYSALNKDDTAEIKKFEESEPNSNEVNIIIAINKLNEGVHISNIQFEISLRPITTNIMFSQQNGRVIRGITPGTLSYNHETQIFDRYNNFFNHRHLKEKEPRIEYDGRKIKEVEKFVSDKGIPNPDSDNIIEARLALNLKRIIATDYDDEKRKKSYEKDKIKKYERIEKEINEIISNLGIKDAKIPERTAKPPKEDIIREGFYDLTDTEKDFLKTITEAKELLNNDRIKIIKGVFGLIDIASAEILKIQNKEITPENINEVLWKLIPDYTMDKGDTLSTMIDRVGIKDKNQLMKNIEEKYAIYLKENGIVRSTFLKKKESIGDFPFEKKLTMLQNYFFSGIETFDEYEIEALAKYRIFPSVNVKFGNISLAKYSEYMKQEGKELRNENFSMTLLGFIIPEKGIDSMSDKFYGINADTLTRYTGDPMGEDPNYIGYDIDGYNEEGYNEAGYNRNGFNKDRIHKDTGTKFDKRGFYEKEGKCINVITETEYDIFGYNVDGKTEEGWDRQDHKLYQKSRRGYRSEGKLFDDDGKDQFECEEYNRETKKTYRPYDFVRNKNGEYYSCRTQEKYNNKGKDVEGFDRNGFKLIRGKYYHRDTGTIFDPNGRTYESIKYATPVETLTTNQIDRGFNKEGINRYTGTIYDLNGKRINEDASDIVRVSFVDKNTGKILSMQDQGLSDSLIEGKKIFQKIHNGKSAEDLIFDYAVEKRISPIEAKVKISAYLKVALDAELINIPREWRIYNKSSENQEIEEIEKFVPNYKELIRRNAKEHNDRRKQLEKKKNKNKDKSQNKD